MRVRARTSLCSSVSVRCALIHPFQVRSEFQAMFVAKRELGEQLETAKTEAEHRMREHQALLKRALEAADEHARTEARRTCRRSRLASTTEYGCAGRVLLLGLFAAAYPPVRAPIRFGLSRRSLPSAAAPCHPTPLHSFCLMPGRSRVFTLWLFCCRKLLISRPQRRHSPAHRRRPRAARRSRDRRRTLSARPSGSGSSSSSACVRWRCGCG